MKLLLVSLLVLLSMAQAFFLAPAPTKPLQRVYSTAGAMLGSATHPLANRKVQFSDNEDDTDRVTQVQLLADGSMSFISDSTMAVDVKGSWRPAEDGKVGFLMERFYSTNADSKYSMIRIYEGVITVSDKSIRGEGKIEQEKYDSLFPCGFFSLISVDDGPDDFFEKLAPGHTVMKGVDQ